MSWVLGLDGGGSKTALAYLGADGTLVGPVYAPGINPFDRPDWEARLTAFLARHPAPGPLAHATLGLPGYGESPDITARQDQVCRSLISAPQTHMNDVQAAFLGAFPGGVGALLLAGTGSMAWASDGVRQVRAGGWGDGFGDEGSAYWIGRAALGVASQALDGRHPDREFPALLLAGLLDGEVTPARLLDWHHAQTHPRSAVATLARTVDALAQAGQATALALLDGAAVELARHVLAVRRQLKLPDLPWSRAGSVLNSQHLLLSLMRELGEAPQPPALPPLGGALYHAARQAGWLAGPGGVTLLATALASPNCTTPPLTPRRPTAPGACMNPTLRSITEQFPYWQRAAVPAALHSAHHHILLGCGTSYYLAQSVAAALNVAGVSALAVPGGEWLSRPQAYLPAGTPARVLAFSRSGESTETVQAAVRSRAAGLKVTALTCDAGSSLARAAHEVLYTETHPEEGIVMTASASLMLLSGLRLAGLNFHEEDVLASQALMTQAQRGYTALIEGRTHFVFLGAGELYGVAQEGALKLQEMSLTFAQAYHPMEYRHGPISLVDERTVVVLLSHPDTAGDEARLVPELRAKGARVLGFGTGGDLSFELPGDARRRAVMVLPALQLLGECVAQARGLDTTAPRWLTKVVTLA